MPPTAAQIDELAREVANLAPFAVALDRAFREFTLVNLNVWGPTDTYRKAEKLLNAIGDEVSRVRDAVATAVRRGDNGTGPWRAITLKLPLIQYRFPETLDVPSQLAGGGGGGGGGRSTIDGYVAPHVRGLSGPSTLGSEMARYMPAWTLDEARLIAAHLPGPAFLRVAGQLGAAFEELLRQLAKMGVDVSPFRRDRGPPGIPPSSAARTAVTDAGGDVPRGGAASRSAGSVGGVGGALPMLLIAAGMVVMLVAAGGRH